MTYRRSAERHSKSTVSRHRPGERPLEPAAVFAWGAAVLCGPDTRARTRGGSAHEGTRSHGLRCLRRHDAAAVSAQAPQNAIWEDLHRRPSFWAEGATWGNSEGEAHDSLDERLVDSLARKHWPYQCWLPPGDSPRRRSLDGTRPRIRIRNTNAVHANPETPRESEDHRGEGSTRALCQQDSTPRRRLDTR